MIVYLATIALVALLGFAVALIIDRRSVGALLTGESLLFGVATASAILFVLSLLHIAWSRTSFLIAALLVLIGTGWLALRVDRTPDEPVIHGSRLAVPLLLATMIAFAGYCLIATSGPPAEFDYLADWGAKGRTFWEARGVDWNFLQEPKQADMIHADYPLLLPLGFDVFAVCAGEWNDRSAGVLNIIFGLGLLLIIYRLAEEELRSQTAAAFLTLAMLPMIASPWMGIAEGPLVAYGTAALLLIRKGSVTAGAVMLGCAAFTKNEGLALIVSVAIAMVVAGKWRTLWKLWPAVAIPLPWLVMRSMLHLSTDITTGSMLPRLITHLRDPELLLALVLYPVGKRLFWIGMVVGVVLTLRRLVRYERFVMTATIIQFAFYIGAYLVTPHDVEWHVRWSWERLISHLTPALTFVVLVNLLRNVAPAPRLDNQPHLY